MALSTLLQSKTSNGISTTPSATFTTTPSPGNLVVVMVGWNSTAVATSFTPDTNITNNLSTAFDGGSGTMRLIMYYGIASKAGPTTFSGTLDQNKDWVMIMLEYAVVSPVPLDKTIDSTGTSASVDSGTTAATSYNNELEIGFLVSRSTTSQTAPTNGFTQVAADTTSSDCVAAAYAKEVSATGTANVSATCANSQWHGMMATFLVGPIPGTTTSTSFTTSTSSTSTSISSTSSSVSSTSTSVSTSSTSTSFSLTTVSTSSTSSSVSSTSISSTSNSTSISSTSTSISSTSISSTSRSTTSSSTSISSTSSSFSSTSSSQSSTSRSTSSTSFSSTSSSSSTSTTTVPPPYIDYTYQDTAAVTTVLQFGTKSPTTWVCPAGVTSVLAEVWGAGGGAGGCDNSSANNASGGAGGGAFSSDTISVTPGTSYTITVGAGGTAGAGSVGTGGALSGGAGGDSSFKDSSTVFAKGGNGSGPVNSPATTGTGASGGSSASGVGSIKKSGGAGADGVSPGQPGGGGGGAGSGGDGGTAAAGGSGTGGIAGPPLGGIGGASSSKTGRAIGGGGSGAVQAGTGGPGAGGMVQLTYTATGLPTTGADDIDRDTNKNLQNLAVYDSDYFIQYGSEYMIQEFQRKHTNTTDNIVFTLKLRTTISTITTPMLIQIYNVNSAVWETLVTVNNIPADTDFSIRVSQTSNVSNYYDSTNQVTFRSYQQVV